MSLKTTSNLIGSAAKALLSTYDVLGTLDIGGAKGMILYVDWVPGSGGTTRSLALKVECAYGDSGTDFYQQTYDVLGSGVNVPTAHEHQIAGIAASTETKPMIVVRCHGRRARISLKETLAGGGNQGVVTVRAVLADDGEDIQNAYLPTISVAIDEFPAAAAVSSDVNAAPTTTSLYSYGMVYDSVANTWVRAKGNALDGQAVYVGTSATLGGWTVAKSAALAPSLVLKASAGKLGKVTGRLDSTLATGTYYLMFIDAASLPVNGAVTTLLGTVKIQHTTGTDSRFDIDVTPDGVTATTGIVLAVSTTDFASLTITASNCLSATGLVK